MEFHEAAVERALAHGFTLAGWTTPNPREASLQRYEQRKRQGALSPFDPEEGVLRMSVERQWPFCQSILALGMSYHGTNTATPPKTGEGRLARVAQGSDYHRVITERIESMMKELSTDYPDLKFEFQVDNGPLSDRVSAWEAGLGFYGKNSFIIHPTWGSYVYLAQVFTNQPIVKVSTPMENRCGDCRRCLDVCPTGALGEEGFLDANRCISWLTQKKGPLKSWERSALGDRLYGCDLCQEVCPYNEQPPQTQNNPFLWDGVRERMHVKTILSMDKDRFQTLFGRNAAGWRGMGILKRNALIVCGNVQNEEHRHILLEHIHDPSELLQLHALFSLAAYDGEVEGIRGVLDRATPSVRRLYEEYR